MVPVKPAWKVTTSGPAALLASEIAWRRLPGPESLRLVTVKVAASAGVARPKPMPRVRAAPEARIFPACEAPVPGAFLCARARRCCLESRRESRTGLSFLLSIILQISLRPQRLHELPRRLGLYVLFRAGGQPPPRPTRHRERRRSKR